MIVEMVGWHDSIREHERLCREAALIRSDALRTGISAAHAWCSVAESYARYQSLDAARNVMAKIHAAMAELDHHLRSPNHVADSALDDLWARFRKLEARVQQLEGIFHRKKARTPEEKLPGPESKPRSG